MTNNCRIGKVTYKKAPHLVEIRPAPRGKELKSSLLKYAEQVSDNFPEGMAGLVVIGWGFDGTFSRGFQIHKDSNVGITMLPAFIQEIMRRDISEAVTRDIL